MNKIIIYIALIIIAVLISSCTSSVRFSGDKSSSSNSSQSSSRTGKSRQVKSDNQKPTEIGKIDRSNNGQQTENDEPLAGEVLTGKASYYGDGFHGNKTASGEIYDQNELTAAHRTIAFGTRIRVKNLKNGRIVEVIINDRGPFKDGRVLDLSYRAAEELDMLDDGVVDVEFVIIDN